MSNPSFKLLSVSEVINMFFSVFRDHDYISMLLLAIIVCVFIGGIFYRMSFIARQENRKELITQWIKGIESIPESEWRQHPDCSPFINEVWYSSLREYMRKEVRQQLERPRAIFWPPDNGGIPTKKILLDEISRIKKEWQLSYYLGDSNATIR